MVEGVEGRFLYTAYIFPVLRTFAVCSAPIRGCRVSGERWMGPDFGDRGRASCPPYILVGRVGRVKGKKKLKMTEPFLVSGSLI